MVRQESTLVMLVQAVDTIPLPEPPARLGRGHPVIYAERLFLKALVVMGVKRLTTVYELLSVLAQDTPRTHQRWRSCVPCCCRRGTAPPPDVGAARRCAGGAPARHHRGLGPPSGRGARPLARPRAGRRHRQHHLAGQGRRLAQEGPAGRGGAAHVHRY